MKAKKEKTVNKEADSKKNSSKNKDDYLKKMTLYVLIPLLLIGLVVYMIDGNDTKIWGKIQEEKNESAKTEEVVIEEVIEETEEVKSENKQIPDSSYMNKKIGKDVYKEAEKYSKKDTLYKQAGKGEDDKNILIDCSGLVVSCYNKALEDTDYTLPFYDATTALLYNVFTSPTTEPNKGDLIFMTFKDDKTVSHVGIVEEVKGKNVYFIDATPNEENKSGQAVNKRKYKLDDKKIIGYGVMKLNKK